VGFATQKIPDLFPVKEEHAYPEIQNADNEFDFEVVPAKNL